MNHQYRVCGLSFASEFELPGFEEAAPKEAADVIIRREPVPERLAEAAYQRENYDADSGVALLRGDGVRFLVRNGTEVLVQAIPGISAAAISTYLSGTVLAALLHQRMTLPLHAGCVLLEDRAIAFVGNSGAGKSTVVAALERRGYPVLAEDVIATRLSNGGPPMVTPGIRRLKLNSDSTNALGLDPSEAMIAENTGKHLWVSPRQGGMDAAPLARIYQLDPQMDPLAAPQVILGLERLEVLRLHTHRWGLAVAMGLGEANMKARMALAAQVAVYRLGRPSRWEDLDRWLDHVERHFRQ